MPEKLGMHVKHVLFRIDPSWFPACQKLLEAAAYDVCKTDAACKENVIFPWPH